jgi:hypothetical protein
VRASAQYDVDDQYAGGEGEDAGTDNRKALAHQHGSPSTVRQAATCSAFPASSSRAKEITPLTFRSAIRL